LGGAAHLPVITHFHQLIQRGCATGHKQSPEQGCKKLSRVKCALRTEVEAG
jgi:hypothetical protein